MLGEDRFQIEELQVRYELEPSLQDVFVEGLFDKELLSEACSKGRNSGRVYYEIEAVNVPNDLVLAAGLTLGNKQRVIALAEALRNLGEDVQRRCLVDRDLDGWIGAIREVPGLRWTKYSCIEAYFLNSDIVRKYMILVAKAKIDHWDAFFQSFVGVLRELFALRLADYELKFGMSWVRLQKSISLKAGQVQFDRSAYTAKLMQTNKGANIHAFETAVSAWLDRLSGDHRAYVRGHDFIFLMAWAIGKLGGLAGYASEESLQQLLIVTTQLTPELSDVLL